MNSEFRRHWTVLLAAGTGVMLGISAIPAFVLGVFAGPMTREFGWSLGAYQGGTLVFTLGILLCSSAGSAGSATVTAHAPSRWSACRWVRSASPAWRWRSRPPGAGGC
jgi:hypothetical protein